jgi:hypothetical protein
MAFANNSALGDKFNVRETFEDWRLLAPPETRKNGSPPEPPSIGDLQH